MKRFKYARVGDTVAYEFTDKTLCIGTIIRIGKESKYNYTFKIKNDSFSVYFSQNGITCANNKMYYYRNGKLCKQLPFLTLLKRMLHLDKSEYINIVLNSDIYNQEPKLVIDKTINIKIN